MNVQDSLFQQLPFGWSLLFLATVMAMVGLVMFWAERLTPTDAGKKRISNILRFGLSGWLALVYLLAEQGWLVTPPNGITPLWLIYGIGLLMVLLPLLIPAARKQLMTIPLTVPIMAQLFRIAQEVPLWQFASASKIPKELSFLGANFDVHVGATSLFVGVAVYAGFKQARYLAIGWNLFGLFVCLATLVNGMGYASVGQPPYPSGNVMAFFPLVWLPALLWPLAAGLHVLSLVRLVGKG